MNDLEKYFTANTGRLIHKWMHYFEIYDRHFSRFRGTTMTLVEFGVSHGGSLQMWANYFGRDARIYGVDINPACRMVEEGQIQILIGDQENRSFLRSIVERIPRIDILIDDGGHTMRQQINTFEELFPRVDAHGVYLCEDTQTSYWDRFGGGYRRSTSFVEYTKNFVDYLNAWHSESPQLGVSDFTRSAHSIHFYDSVLVVEKRPMERPHHQQKGVPCVPDYVPPERRRSWFRVFR